MNYITYFKSQAKKFYKDFQTQYIPENDEFYSYKPKFWADIDEIILSFDIDEDNFSLMKAQHIIALLANLGSWNRLVHANEYQLELGYYLIEHRNDNYDHNLVEEWQMYLRSANLDDIDDASKLDVFKHVFLNME